MKQLTTTHTEMKESKHIKHITRQEVMAHVEISVALFWLRGCLWLLRRGDSPAKLTPMAHKFVRDELADETLKPLYGGWQFIDRDIDEMAAGAKAAALNRLYADKQWERVRNYFGVVAAKNAVAA